MNASEMKSLELEAQKFSDYVLSTKNELEFTPRPEAKSVKEAWAKIFVAVGIRVNEMNVTDMNEREVFARSVALRQWAEFVPNNANWVISFADLFMIFWKMWQEKKTKWEEWQDTKTLARKSEENS